MNKELVKDFQTRIVNAGRGELLIINYEMLLAQINDAKHVKNISQIKNINIILSFKSFWKVNNKSVLI